METVEQHAVQLAINSVRTALANPDPDQHRGVPGFLTSGLVALEAAARLNPPSASS